MKKIHIKYTSKFILGIYAISLTFLNISCEKFLEAPLPTDKVAGEAAYLNDQAAGAVISGILTKLVKEGTESGRTSIGVQVGMYTDDLTDLSTPDNSLNLLFYKNALSPQEDVTPWWKLYNTLFNCNLAINNIREDKYKLTFQNQWLGEALFIRALAYSNLAALFGDAVITESTDAQTNRYLGRSPQAEVYKQVIDDLKEAQSLLSEDYKDALGNTIANNRTRPNKYAATALLARVYLTLGRFEEAEVEATKVIDNTAFIMESTATNFLATSKETIWALAPVGTGFVEDYRLYNGGMAAVIPPGRQAGDYIKACMSDDLVSQFEVDDERMQNWVRTSVTSDIPVQTYYFPNKYKTSTHNVEHIVEFRLAEQYLIRAEARARQNDVENGRNDLLQVRNRAGLSSPTFENKESLIESVLKERRLEFFTEFTHRFVDLKRTGQLDNIMSECVKQKGTKWYPYMKFWPIPDMDIQLNKALIQTDGY